MKKSLGVLFAFFVVFGAIGIANATFIDFEAYSDQQNLNGINLGGVTLTSPNGVVEVYANNRLDFSYHSAANSISNYILGSGQDKPIIGVFDTPKYSMKLWAGDAGGDIDSFRLEVYDAINGGNLIASVFHSGWDGDPYTNAVITVFAGNIMRFEAWNPSNTGIAFDDLSFSSPPVPNPSTILS